MYIILITPVVASLSTTLIQARQKLHPSKSPDRDLHPSPRIYGDNTVTGIRLRNLHNRCSYMALWLTPVRWYRFSVNRLTVRGMLTIDELFLIHNKLL